MYIEPKNTMRLRGFAWYTLIVISVAIISLLGEFFNNRDQVIAIIAIILNAPIMIFAIEYLITYKNND